jgi:hypothetical protein
VDSSSSRNPICGDPLNSRHRALSCSLNFSVQSEEKSEKEENSRNAEREQYRDGQQSNLVGEL